VGVSDRTGGAVTLEERMDDVRAVLDAVGSTGAALIGWADGAALVALFAATYPERVEALVLGAVAATFDEGASPPGLTEAARGELVRAAATEAWGSADFLSILAPSAADDQPAGRRVLAAIREAGGVAECRRGHVAPNA
jgi:pimeloyl-ACP methyl ester carboxylesterase